MFPHFVCPNCRSVADLEAELDDPYANGEWEEIPSELVNESTQTPEPEEPPVVEAQHPQVLVEDFISAAVTTELPIRGLSLRHESSDIELPDASDSEVRPPSVESPLASSDSLPLVSSATVPAVNIISRRSISENHTGNSAHLRNLQRPRAGSRERQGVRTPSPNGLPSSLTDGIGSEGPMTPRNDVGPFIFDGSAGRAGAVSPAVNLDEVADAPSSRLSS